MSSDLELALADMGEHNGYHGYFTRHRATGAVANGTRVVKVMFEEGDANPLGTTGAVLGSIYHPDAGLAYFVEWDTMPKKAVLVVESKIKTVSSSG